ncbi:hypothetical protein Hdeb2414_s0069g00771591 [Helianthus debilis subsp. tardiflorus]
MPVLLSMTMRMPSSEILFVLRLLFVCSFNLMFVKALEPDNLVPTLIWISLSMRITVIVDPTCSRCFWISLSITVIVHP